ncbi:MAG: ATP-dependent DNA helicase RecG [Gemmatimonadetes bacterium]|nr:ATP-dependent DNA helicase RecG [Gemmatimonadota bacterium]
MREINDLEVSIESVKGVGAKRGAVLREVGIHTLADLLLYLPRRYLDRRQVLPIARAPSGQELTLVGQVRQMRFVPGARPRFTMVVEDESDDISCVWFRGGNYLQRNFKEGDVLALSGKVEIFQGRHQMVHPEYEFIEASGAPDLLHTGGIIPLYTSSADMKERGLRSRGFRRIMRRALDEFKDKIPDEMPGEMMQRLVLPGLRESFERVHFPRTMEEVQAARRRLAFDELFDLQLRLVRLRRQRLREGDGIAFSRPEKLVQRVLAKLPFELTRAQERAIGEIEADMEHPFPMARLLQGDVGSGKTLVALCALLVAVENQYQSVLMAPTEILAEQHYLNIKSMVEPLGVAVVLLAGRKKAAARKEVLQALESGAGQIIVGTHALFQDEVNYFRLGLAVVDEQHRFGVVQRSELYRKGNKIDVLMMTATPIPRTLTLTIYGDQEVSLIDELPAGRKSVRTVLRPADRRELIFKFAADQVRQGRQVYVVYPLIDESEKVDLKSAIEGYDELRQGVLAEFNTALLHGRMATEEKAEVMDAFKKGEIQVLCSTTVIEVGVDVPNATLMIIEHAERFGLAQLHQLRGRVGRGPEQSYCILVNYAKSVDADANQRLKILCASQNGFEIAEKDLEIRGPGEVLGTRQAGMPEFVVADLIRDADLLEVAREEAERVVRQHDGETPEGE